MSGLLAVPLGLSGSQERMEAVDENLSFARSNKVGDQAKAAVDKLKGVSTVRSSGSFPPTCFRPLIARGVKERSK